MLKEQLFTYVHAWNELVGIECQVCDSRVVRKGRLFVGTMLILMRHGQSMWNRDPNKPQFPWKYCGSLDIPLSEAGIRESMRAGRALREIPIDLVYCSMLVRAQTTTLIALASHEDGNAPLLVRDTPEDEKKMRGLRAHLAQMSETSYQTVLPVYCSHQLDERSFGVLQGMYEAEQQRKFSKTDLRSFRRDWNTPFPGGESEAQVYDRTIAFFERHIRPQLVAGKNVLVCCHGFVVRALIAHILDLDPESYHEQMNLDLKKDPSSLLHSENAIPRIFKYESKGDEDSYIDRGVFKDVTSSFPLDAMTSKL